MKPAGIILLLSNFALITGLSLDKNDILNQMEVAPRGQFESLLKLFDVRDDVEFQLYSKEFEGYRVLKPVTVRQFTDFIFLDASKETKVVIHGWMNSKFCRVIKEAYLSSDQDYNIISVDWSRLAINFYTFARISVHLVAPYVAELLDHLVQSMGVAPENIHLLGHSLGAHVAGLAGASMTTGKVGRITGLDPAAPLFFLGKDYRLDSSNALFVDVIHTSLLGYQNPIGHADFYPNGGGPTQPGCGFDIAKCTHARAYHFYVESITSRQKFLAWSCTSWSEYKKGQCENTQSVYMGESTPHSARGTFYLKTGEVSLFSLRHQNYTLEE